VYRGPLILRSRPLFTGQGTGAFPEGMQHRFANSLGWIYTRMAAGVGRSELCNT